MLMRAGREGSPELLRGLAELKGCSRKTCARPGRGGRDWSRARAWTGSRALTGSWRDTRPRIDGGRPPEGIATRGDHLVGVGILRAVGQAGYVGDVDRPVVLVRKRGVIGRPAQAVEQSATGIWAVGAIGAVWRLDHARRERRIRGWATREIARVGREQRDLVLAAVIVLNHDRQPGAVLGGGALLELDVAAAA